MFRFIQKVLGFITIFSAGKLKTDKIARENLGVHPTIHRDRLPGYVATVGAREPQHGLGNFSAGAHAAERYLVEHFFFGFGGKIGGHFGVDKAGGYRVHADISRG
jgi:hypothetical protein